MATKNVPEYGMPNATKISWLCRLDCSSFSQPCRECLDRSVITGTFTRTFQGPIPGMISRTFQGSIPGTISRTFHDIVASFPGRSRHQFLIACSMQKRRRSSLVPRPRPAFHRLQYGKAGRAWYLFPREHDVIGKWRKFSEQTGCISRIVQPTTHSTLGVYDNCPPLARYVR